MSTMTGEPGPRAGLDEGTVHDLWLDAAQVVLPDLEPRDLHLAAAGEPLVVPAEAASLVDELAPYGS